MAKVTSVTLWKAEKGQSSVQDDAVGGIDFGALPLSAGSPEEALYKRYKDDDSASWFYARALLDFRKYGDGEIANSSLQAAFGLNKFVPDYLLWTKKLPARMPSFYSPGGRDEAVLLAKDYTSSWQASANAIRWLSQNWQQYKPGKKKDPAK